MPSYFRIVPAERPSPDDFRSNRLKGEPHPPSTAPDLKVAMWAGVSVYDTLARAQQKARDLPLLGSYVTELDLAGGPKIPVARTNGRGHFTAWGEPDELFACQRGTFAV